VAVALLAGLAGCSGEGRPNILFIVIDTARADRFPWHGSARPTAPRLDALAREGTVYINATSPAPWTVPAHASLFTGQYPSLHHTDCGSLKLPDEEVTLAEALQSAGYRTVAYVANPWLGSTFNFTQGFDTWVETWHNLEHGGPDTGAQDNSEHMEAYLRWYAGSLDARSRPFFMFVNYLEPHLPYHPPEPERSRLLRAPVDPARLDHLMQVSHPDEMAFILGRSDLTPSDMAVLNDLYDGEIAYVDRRIGEVVDLMRRLDLLDRTILVVTSDHGENIGDHGLMDHKMSVDATLLHVPLLLRYPRRVAAGVRVETPVQTHDLYPTLLALARASLPEGTVVESVPLPGVDLPGTWGRRSAPRRPEDPIIGEFAGPPSEFMTIMAQEFPGADLSRYNRTLVSLSHGGWTIHWGSDGHHTLFHAADDPGELRDLASSEPARIESMTQEVDAWLHRPARSRLVAPASAPAAKPRPSS
jgi:arylsulfatase A-like enzyme